MSLRATRSPAPLLLGLTVLGLYIAPLAAQDDDPRRHGIFVDAVEVSLINLEVVATRNGEAVTDLTQEDFEILDDGEPVAISHFSRVVDGRRAAPERPSDGTSSDRSPSDDALRPREPSTVVVLFDQPSVSPSSRRRVLENLQERLDVLLAEGARIMVTRKHLDIAVLQEPTTDRRAIVAALDSAARDAVSTQSHEAAVRRILTAIERGSYPGEGAAGGTDLGEKDALQTYQQALVHAREDAQDVRHAVRAVRPFLSALGGLPGRKALLWVGDRLAARPGADVMTLWFARYGDDYGADLGAFSMESVLHEFETHREIRELIDEASAAGIAVYPVGTERSIGARAISAESGSTGLTPSAMAFENQPESVGLDDLAAGTGGRAAVSGGAPGPLLDAMRRDLTHYYSLAYASPHRGDGESHKVELRIRRPGVELAYLRTYRDQPPELQMRGRTVAALFYDAEENPLGVEVEIKDIRREHKTTLHADLEVRFPLASLVLMPREDAHVGRVSIWLASRDAEGRMSEPVRIVAPIEVPNAGLLEAIARTAAQRTTMALRPGPQTLAVGVHDEIGGTTSTVRLQVDAPER